MRNTRRELIIGAAASLVLVGTLGACDSDEGSAPTPEVDAPTSSAPADTGSTGDGGSGASDVVADCDMALEGTSVALGEKISCDGWIVTVIDFQENVALPAGVELQDQFTGDTVDASASVAAATVEVSAIGDGFATAYTDFAWALAVGDTIGGSDDSTDPLIAVEPGSTQPGSLPEPLPVSCLVEDKAPCTGQVYFEVDEMDLSGEVYVQLHSPTDESMGSVQVK